MFQFTVIFQGRLGSDPEKKVTQGGKEFIEINVAHSFSVGTEHQKTMWVTCSCWKDISQRMIDTLKKGSLVSIVGILTNFSSYMSKNNEPKSSFYVKVLNISYVNLPKPKSENPEQLGTETSFEEVPF